jgi:hypothetical protein
MTLNTTLHTDRPEVAWIGPMAVLAALLFSFAAGRVWDRLVGETACRWRVAYAPDNRIYAIWALLYGGGIVAVLLQWLALALPRELAVLDWWTNLGWAGAWVAGGLWVIVFAREAGCHFWASAVVLACGAASAVVALWSEGAWRAGRSDVRAAAIVTSAPLALLAGWLLVAASLNVGIAIRATSGTPEDCQPYYGAVRRITFRTEQQQRRIVWRALEREEAARNGAQESSLARAPLVLIALVVAALAFVAYEPLLPLPLLLRWASPGVR